jgi:tRNA A37 threonylcarbamoyladenosine modification protein TsaB
LDSFLDQQNMDKKSIQGVAVVVGVGGFTSTRIATTLANAWHFVQKIPVLAVSAEEASKPQKLIEKFTSENYILAEYSGEPNLGR